MDHDGRTAGLHRQLRLAVRLLRAVEQGASLTDALNKIDPPERPGAQALSFHVMRWRGSAQACRRLLAPKTPAPDVDALLTCALALMWPLDQPPYPAHTLVDEAVTCARKLAPHSAGFVNAVLRGFLRRRVECESAVQQDPQARHNHPLWWVQQVQQDWGEPGDAVLQAAQAHPPLTLRANRRHGDVQSLAPALEAVGLGVRPMQIRWPSALTSTQSPTPSTAQRPTSLPHAATLEPAVAVHRIPGFSQGHWSVQDASAQLAAPLLLEGLEPRGAARLRVLDACSAPGGKTAHLLEWADLDLLALDADARRLERVRDNLQRLGLNGPNVQLKATDARHISQWWDGQPFDAILLDAPCSASGIVRRHPDARWLRRQSDIPALVHIQAELLDALWPLLKPGGRLLYATCSVFKAEGQAQIDAFLQRHRLSHTVVDARSPGHILPVPDNPGTPQTTGGPGPVQVGDGFYYALLNSPSAL